MKENYYLITGFIKILVIYPQNVQKNAGFSHISGELRSHGHRNAHAHNPNEPRKHQVRNVQAIPRCVLNPPESSAAGIDKNHYHNGNASECVQTL